ncbi:hypothetical protein H6G20_08130 [Desertifilum sp. FACHB-1129]|uniref:Uncharacterized protein n=2 Tax=Desertifilaceae TaxID=1969992 RepID=A0A1E5QPW0_9CYAN|nr:MULTISPECIES: hypothetical protein [unclassified Desertifilum]MDA0209351.1 hypothetical protein [Cyanobacteria bacterium FC1]OEJ76383.1 hypothetical protein BH720_04720 [Desertifilum tharense IPPAS B-1220]MBD2311625.1 hypothetical protein [Desertifilum sp. FACHB-1129]MBD2322850.1 hypothetical protein [Desertifilum sp. FACHB-866]MBD2332756.1 hypothetical protein [Desertifilum sp. FACHB-868]
MRADLQGLLIAKGELRRLTGVGLNDVFIPPTWKKFSKELGQTLLLLLLLAASCVILSLSFRPYFLYLVGAHSIAGLTLLIADIQKVAFSIRSRGLIRLFEDVVRYNSIIHSLDINDQIEDAGNPSAQLQNRDRVIEALTLTRSDLIRALKTERILRENQQFISQNPELFANNLESLAALQVSDRASEYGRLLNEAMQVAVGVREEMKKMQQ